MNAMVRTALFLILSTTATYVVVRGARAHSTAHAQLISAENWGEQVGFRVDLGALRVPPDTIIHKENMETVKSLLPPGLQLLIRKYELKLNLTPYEPYRPSDAYIQATNEQRGKAKIRDTGNDYRKAAWTGYAAGLPFPAPKDGREVAYNFLNSYVGDDADRYYDVTWVSAHSGVETTEYWHWLSLRIANRTDLAPTPTLPGFGDARYRSASLTIAVEPYDKKGFAALYFTSLDPVDLTGHVYVPPLRRILRQTFGTRGDSWNATDYLFEDVGGYLGAAEWMHWTILEKKTMLLPANSGAKYGKSPGAVFDLKTWPHWNPKVQWQPRPVFVLEARPKIPDYPYTRMLLLVDAESYSVLYKEAYDKQGRLWKIILNGGNPSVDAAHQPALPGFSVALDLQGQHATLISFRKVAVNTNLPPARFSTDEIRRQAH